MSVFSGPLIVDSDLSLYLDAANLRSYSGSGTTWTDMSGNGRHATIVPRITGYTFNNTYFTFPASATPYQYGYVTSPIPTGPLSWTVECVIRVPEISGERHIFRTSGNFGCDFSLTNRLRFYMTEYNVETAFTPTNSFFPNEWIYLTMTYDRSEKIQSVYKNGIFVSSKNHTVQYNISSSTNLWLSRSDGYIDGLGGDVAVIKFYSRALTLSEIKRNFEAIRGRFGI